MGYYFKLENISLKLFGGDWNYFWSHGEYDFKIFEFQQMSMIIVLCVYKIYDDITY